MADTTTAESAEPEPDEVKFDLGESANPVDTHGFVNAAYRRADDEEPPAAVHHQHHHKNGAPAKQTDTAVAVGDVDEKLCMKPIDKEVHKLQSRIRRDVGVGFLRNALCYLFVAWSRIARPQRLASLSVADAVEDPRSRLPAVRLCRSRASGGSRLCPPPRPVAVGAGRDAARGRLPGGVRQDAGGAAGRGALHGRRRRAEEARQQARHRRRERLDTAVEGDAQVAGVHVVEGLHGRRGGDPAAGEQSLLADPREGVPLHRLSHEGGVRVRGEVVLRGHRLQRPPAPHEAQVRAGRGAGRVLP